MKDSAGRIEVVEEHCPNCGRSWIEVKSVSRVVSESSERRLPRSWIRAILATKKRLLKISFECFKTKINIIEIVNMRTLKQEQSLFQHFQVLTITKNSAARSFAAKYS